MLRHPHLAWFYAWAFGRHCQHRDRADYEVCRHPLCRLAWGLEQWLWYDQETPVHRLMCWLAGGRWGSRRFWLYCQITRWQYNREELRSR